MTAPGPKTLFVSDLHIGRSHPEIAEQFSEFLSGTARRSERLYILGDLFEAWIGDDAAGAIGRAVVERLRQVAEAGTEIHFARGNRDFLLGEDYCRSAGMQLLDQPRTIDLYGTPTVILHGDTLCTLDRAYQRYRARVSDPDWQRRMLAKPVWFRRSIAQMLRMASRIRNRNSGSPVMDVTDDAVAALFRATGAVRMIHGHTHRPFRHRYTIDGTERERIVLGDWYEQGSALVATPESIELKSLVRAD